MRSFVNNAGATHCDSSPIEGDLTTPLDELGLTQGCQRFTAIQRANE